MKRYIHSFILLGALCLTNVSCSDFLTEEDKVDIEKNDFLNSADEAETVLLGVYQATIGDAMYGMNLSFYFNMGTDCEQVEGNTTENFRIVPTNAYPTTQAEVEDAWQGLYVGIYRANDFLERLSTKIDAYSEDDKNLATIYMGEARALRAMFYFELVRRFGHVPLFTTTTMSYQDPAEIVQEDPVKVYEQIEADLKYAIDVLPYATDDTYRTDNSFRFSKGAAMGLLAKVYATWAGNPINDTSKWEQAAKVAGSLIMSGKHDLLTNFEQLWKNTANGIWDPTESLIEISFYSPTTTGAASDPCGRIGKWNGIKTTAIADTRGSCAGNVKVVHSFVLNWRAEDGVDQEHPDGTKGIVDLRRDLSIGNYRYDNSLGDGPILWAKGTSDTQQTALTNDLDPTKKQKEKQNYTPAKWDVVKYVESGNALINNDKSNVNWYFLRYADVLLIYAEALNEWKGGPTNEAYAAVNKVRRRAYGNPSSTTACDLQAGLDQEGFRQAIRNERAYELAFEGHRRMDLVRWGIYYETVQQTYNELVNNWWSSANYVVQKYTVKGKHELMPIPQREMDLCKQFKQNPGWD